MKKILWLIPCLALPAWAYAASYDCGKASTAVEKLICSDDQLSQLDDELVDIYKHAVKEEKGGSVIKNSQGGWLKSRNNCGTSPYAKDKSWLAACIKHEYEYRLAAITSTPFYLHECAFPSRTNNLGYVYAGSGGGWEKIFDALGMREMQKGFFRYIYYDKINKLFVEAWQQRDGKDIFAGCIEVDDKDVNAKGAYDFQFTPVGSFSMYLDMKLPSPTTPVPHRVRIPFYFIWNTL
jgi:uncharacterized protein YecT (DUF1311 family)